MTAPPSRGFFSRRPRPDPTRVPPGQYVTDDFPVLSAGPTPHIPLVQWRFEIGGAVENPHVWTWDELNALPTETITRDIHCVTKWTHLDMVWTGVSLDVLFEVVRPTGDYLACTATAATRPTSRSRTPPTARRGSRRRTTASRSRRSTAARPALVPHLYFWKSAKWVRGLEVRDEDQPGFWEVNGYHNYGDPWLEQRYWGD